MPMSRSAAIGRPGHPRSGGAEPAVAALITRDRRLRALCEPVGDSMSRCRPEPDFRKALRLLGMRMVLLSFRSQGRLATPLVPARSGSGAAGRWASRAVCAMTRASRASVLPSPANVPDIREERWWVLPTSMPDPEASP